MCSRSTHGLSRSRVPRLLRGCQWLLVLLSMGCFSFPGAPQAKYGPQTAQTLLATIRPVLNTELMAVESEVALVGHYSSAGSELAATGIAVFEGNDLYLYPDRSYVYTEWGDLTPPTVRERGTWGLRDGILTLEAKEQHGPKVKDSRFLPFSCRFTRKERIALLGTHYSYSYFMEFHAEDGLEPERMLLLCVLEKLGPTAGRKLGLTGAGSQGQTEKIENSPAAAD